MAKITVLTGSCRKGGNTELLATAFYNGAKQSHEVEIISITDYQVNPCTGCNACRGSHMQKACCQNDDMQAIYEKLSDTDILVIASPVYFYGISAQLKAIIDRLHSPKRNEFHIKKLGLLLVAADSIPEVFDSIKVQYQLVLDYFKLSSIGEICVGGVEDKGVIQGNPALEEAFHLGEGID